MFRKSCFAHNFFFTSTCLGSLVPFTCVYAKLGNWKLLLPVAMKKDFTKSGYSFSGNILQNTFFEIFFYMLYGRYVSFKVEMNMMRALKIYDSL